MIKYRLQQIGTLVFVLLLAILWFVMFNDLRVNHLTMATNELLWLLFIMTVYSCTIVVVYNVSGKIINDLSIKIKEVKKNKEVK